jgi:hypothetical protein
MTVHFISKEFKSLSYFALLAQWIVHIEFLLVKATKKKMRKFCGGKQALQRRVHVASVADVGQTEILWTPGKQSQMCDMRSTQCTCCKYQSMRKQQANNHQFDVSCSTAVNE